MEIAPVPRESQDDIEIYILVERNKKYSLEYSGEYFFGLESYPTRYLDNNRCEMHDYSIENWSQAIGPESTEYQPCDDIERIVHTTDDASHEGDESEQESQ